MKKQYILSEIEIIFVQAENIIVTSTPFGNDGEPDTPGGWKDITKG